MRTRTEVKPKGPKKANPQQVVYELKHRVVVALNKIADRDTYQIGVEELEKTAESLNPDGIIPFLSCVLDTDSEQKSAVRKECVRMMGMLAKIHGNLVGPHLGKMVASIVKRLKDQESIVRDTCVETMGVLASEFGNHQVESDGIFVLLVRPLFEALGEQNKHIQLGAAMCLARVIDSMNDPPGTILQKMLSRTMKLLKNTHFVAKPAVIELNRSLIQAGGALSHSALSTALCGFQEALKDRDWTTRKAASLALGDIASSGGPFLSPFKASCIQALESCRFDKVKPVRDAVSKALSCWKSINGHDVPEPPDSMSGTKDTLFGDHRSDLASASSSTRKLSSQSERKMNTIKSRNPVSVRKGSQNSCNLSNDSNWHIGIAVPKAQNDFSQYLNNEVSESNSATKIVETVTADVISMQSIGRGYDLMDEKDEYSSSSNHVSVSCADKFMEAAPHCSLRGDLIEPIEGDQQIGVQAVSGGVNSYKSKMEDCRSFESSITDAEECQPVHVSCFQTENEISSIKKQLLEIEKKQSSLMDILQGFTTSTMESLSVIQMKVSSLEHAVDRISLDLADRSKHTNVVDMQHIQKCPSVSGSVISTTSTPRLSVDIEDRKSCSRPSRNREVWEGKATSTRIKTNSINPCMDSQRQPLSMMNRKVIGAGTQISTRQDSWNMSYLHQSRRNERLLPSVLHDNSRQSSKVGGNDPWKRVKSFLNEGVLDLAYREALYSGDVILLTELINGTGPVLDSLSDNTVNNLLSALTLCVSEHGILDSFIPWLQQILELSTIHGPNYIPVSLKVRREIISALQEALDLEVAHPPKRRLIAQLAMKLQHIWGKTSSNIS